MSTVLQAYDRARAALAEAATVTEVLALRDEIAHIELYARQVRNRELIEQAMVLQLRAERRLGMLLAAAFEAGQLARGRRRKDDTERVTLAEIGVDERLSATAQRAAKMDDAEFDAAVERAREKIRAGRAIVIDPVKEAEKTAEIEQRRAAHAARTKGGCNVKDLGNLALTGWRAGAIGCDPQWKFLAYSEAGDGRSANVHYKTEGLDRIKDMPVGDLAAKDCALFMWVVDWYLHGAIELMSHWGFEFKTVAFTWAKTNGEDVSDPFDESTWHMGQGYWSRANPEMCLLGTRGAPQRLHADVRQLIVAPLRDHSCKPDAWLERIERLVEGPYLELNARRRRPGWVAWGDELEWEDPEQAEGKAA
ncbi:MULTISPECIES: MT-A70 family methyltransferase [unclassified Bradyrhizobium]|uniref:MT-A70 family methyltransferase n=1 Tax=unclassified Bradyrhizobium TaxID=2631580 RepID=UPI00291641A6|nr:MULTISPECIES: MT-A70 family methyltransferase [unclassified Bradyrhizobium]